LDQIGITLTLTGFTAEIGGVEMSPFETVRVTVTFSAEIDEKFMVGVVEKVNDALVGGITYIRELPNCVYLPMLQRNYLPSTFDMIEGKWRGIYFR
jgi:hypothetical protein